MCIPAEMISNLVLSNEGHIITAGEAYNYPVYFADEQTPRWDIPCVVNMCTVANSDQDVIRTDMVQNVPIPVDARPGEDTDARMIIIDKATLTEYDLSKAQRTTIGWTAGTVSVYNILWDGTPVMHSSRWIRDSRLCGAVTPMGDPSGSDRSRAGFRVYGAGRREMCFSRLENRW